MTLFIHSSAHQSIHSFVNSSDHQSIEMSIHPSVHPYITQSISPFIRWAIHSSIHQSIDQSSHFLSLTYQSVHLSTHKLISLSIYQPCSSSNSPSIRSSPLIHQSMYPVHPLTILYIHLSVQPLAFEPIYLLTQCVDLLTD
ncbi:hypothetical protein XENORESO_007521 [Xenotaenia resolanae]|uniref:Uncharacterized protein n=1 Tax=Xenotaenia resolanae TaxID=208358 RepID=A0ABV0VX18_9TELE